MFANRNATVKIQMFGDNEKAFEQTLDFGEDTKAALDKFTTTWNLWVEIGKENGDVIETRETENVRYMKTKVTKGNPYTDFYVWFKEYRPPAEMDGKTAQRLGYAPGSRNGWQPC